MHPELEDDIDVPDAFVQQRPFRKLSRLKKAIHTDQENQCINVTVHDGEARGTADDSAEDSSPRHHCIENTVSRSHVKHATPTYEI